jgi:putative membrane protein
VIEVSLSGPDLKTECDLEPMRLTSSDRYDNLGFLALYNDEVSKMMWPYGYGPGWGWMIGGWIMMLVFWALVIIGIVALVRFLSDRDRSGPGRPKEAETPLEILRRRYAAGELTKEQFDEMKRNVA